MKAFETIRSLREKLEKKEISAHEVLSFYHERSKKHDQTIQSYLEVFDKESVANSASKDESILAGIPGAIKDNICQKDRIASCSSRILQNYKAPYDATATARLKNAGAFIVGRTNCDEFAMGSSTETSAYQLTKNPWDTTRVPGGSGGGSAAAVAAGLVPWALGSETGGSVRNPAALCGIVGLKPTYGLISRYGLVSYCSSIDQIGINTHTAYDAAMVLSVIAGKDQYDSTTLPVEKKDYTKSLDQGISKGLRIGVVTNLLYAQGMDPEIVQANEEAIRVLESLGAVITNIEMPILSYSAAAYFILSRAEAASNLARFDGVRYGLRSKEAVSLQDMYCNTRHDGFGKEVKARILVGNYVLSAGHAGSFYENANKVCALMRQSFIDTFKNVDLLVMPTHSIPAFQIGSFNENKLQLDLQDFFTCPANLTGIPALSIPGGFTKNRLPIGFQFVGPALSDELLLRVAHAYQQKTDWHTQHPSGF